MAYMNQEKKAVIATALKRVVPKSWKYSLAVDNGSTLCMTIRSAPVDLIALSAQEHKRDYLQVNHHYADRAFTDEAVSTTIQAIVDALNLNNHDNSDSQSDYFDVGHYVRLNIGSFGKPFIKQ